MQGFAGLRLRAIPSFSTSLYGTTERLVEEEEEDALLLLYQHDGRRVSS
jgi:hypothetical protein